MPFIESLMLAPGEEIHIRVTQENSFVVTITSVNSSEATVIHLDRESLRMLITILASAEEHLSVY